MSASAVPDLPQFIDIKKKRKKDVLYYVQHQMYSAEGEIEKLDQTQLQSVWLFRDGLQQQAEHESTESNDEKMTEVSKSSSRLGTGS